MLVRRIEYVFGLECTGVARRYWDKLAGEISDSLCGSGLGG